jgi:hypothetical protein
MHRIDPEVRERLAMEALRELVLRHYDGVRTLIDDDTAFEPGRLAETRHTLRAELRALEEIAAEALRP